MAPPSRTARKKAAEADRPKASLPAAPEPAQPEPPPATTPAGQGAEEDEAAIDLATEVAPAGKHQGKTFRDVAEDRAFCTWLCREPRTGWMGLLKVYLETELGFQLDELAIVEVDEEEAARLAQVAVARAKLLAKGAGKGAAAKKKPEPPQAPPVARLPFQPTREWQEVLPEHLCPKGLQFRMDIKSGKNFARLIC